MRQFATAEAGRAHWQATSEVAQEAAEMADLMQDVAHGGSPVRFCATDKLTPAARARIESFILIV